MRRMVNGLYRHRIIIIIITIIIIIIIIIITMQSLYSRYPTDQKYKVLMMNAYTNGRGTFVSQIW